MDLAESEVHVWSLPLDLPLPRQDQAAAALSPAERERAARFALPQARRRFIAGRGQLRELLGRYLERDPATLEFESGPHGKPALAGAAAASGLQFNLAHSDNLALLAVTRSGPVGVDLERIRPLPDIPRLVARFFSPRENAAFQALRAQEQTAAFFNLWTRKEAWLKATGEGIGQLLAQVEVSFVPGEPVRLLSLPDGVRAVAGWRLEHLEPAPGFVGALVADASAGCVRCFSIHPSRHSGPAPAFPPGWDGGPLPRCA